MNDKSDVLVVEDEPVVLAAIRKILESDHIQIDEAASGEKALSKLRSRSYDLILTDLMLPEISGLDLIGAIKNGHPCVPVVVISGYATFEKALQSFMAGSFDFVSKPFDTEVFLGAVRRGLNFSRLMSNRGFDQRAFIHLPLASGLDRSTGALYCLGCHAWVKFDAGGTALIGVGETFPNMMGILSHMEIVHSSEEIVQGKGCVQFVTAEGLVNPLRAPLSGKIEAANENLERDIGLINSDPYDRGWIFRIDPYNFDEEVKHLTRCTKRPDNAQ